MSELHFSPRPNRAHEIHWQPWDAGTFARAKAEDKPILLAISAVWCHWCHVMDETSYSDESVIAKINDAYVPVRVDNDLRPDINARYNQGGWPTTAFLTPGGSLLAGATYLPPAQMSAALDEIGTFYRTNRAQIEERSLQLRSQKAAAQAAPAHELPEEAHAQIVAAIEAQFDQEYGGFGSEPKFPMTDVLELLLLEYRATRSQRPYEMLARTLLAMSGGGMYDHLEGGFFRYSTTRDWSVPHFEKMTEDHGPLLRILASLVRETRNTRFRETLLSAAGYVRDVLRDQATHLFAGSQDADETYYALPLEERRKIAAPYIDRRSYSNWSAAMGAAFVAAGSVLEDDHFVNMGLSALDALHALRDANGLLYHVLEPAQAPRIRGLLTDQAAYLRALLDAHELTGEPRLFDRAVDLAGAIERHFAAPGGGFFDHAAIEQTLGALDVRDRPLPDNASLADSFLRLSAMGRDEHFAATARAALQVHSQTSARMGLFAAPYARVLRRAQSPCATLTLTGSAEQMADLREAALRLPDPLLTIRTREPQDGEAGGAGYLCLDAACAAPARDARELRDAYESLRR
ncbi:MAG: thioredoxin domain-containing protein [Candidatus Baltobacteraceae bacterium]